jgi:glycosyltransferase involved in cell wall biosynthesis
MREFPRGIVVTVPAYREEKLIARTLASIPEEVEGIIVVDDASDDDTCAVVEDLAARDGRIHLHRHARNGGVGAAIKSGYRLFLEGRGEICVVMAGDAQMDPADLPRLLAPVLAGKADYAKGNRLDQPEVRSVMPGLRYWGSQVLSRLTRLSSGYHELMDSQCGYTAATRAILERIDLGAVYDRYGVPNDLLMRLNLAGARVADVPVRPIYGDEVSGIRLGPTVPRLLALLGRGFARRLWCRRDRLFAWAYLVSLLAFVTAMVAVLGRQSGWGGVAALSFAAAAFAFAFAWSLDRRVHAAQWVRT